MSSKKKILYFYPKLSSFIKKDLDIISKHYDLKSKGFFSKNKLAIPLLFISQKLFLLQNVWDSELIICRFGGYHSFLPAMFGKIIGKPVLIIQGAQESIYFPSIQTGNYCIPFYGFITRLSLKWATHHAPVDETLVESDYTYDDTCPPKQGYKVFAPKAVAPFTVIHNGYDPEKFYRRKDIDRNINSFITVALSVDGREFFRKGVDLIFEIAPKFPNCTFTIVGGIKDPKLRNAPENVKIHAPVPHDQLVELYSAHEFYLQLSMAEGFPNSLCEAMLCECIPIGSDVFGIPKIINGCGFLLRKKDVNKLVNLLKEALSSNRQTLQIKARQHIESNFPLSRREKELIDLVERLTS